uniref:Phosphodiesterase 2A n=1 Tax=Chelonoidis abingdonii TaxID=106734 RepID=A0A8C0IZC9_CHEAB
MVLILPHILIAVVQFFRRGQQVFLKAEEKTPLPPPRICAPSPPDALLSLGSVIDVACLREVIKDAITSVLPKVEHVYIYLLDGEARLTCDDPPHELPPEGKIRPDTVASY